MTTSLLDRLRTALGGTYRLDRELAGGGMSRVFVATEVALNRAVVLKVLPPDPELMTEWNAAKHVPFQRRGTATPPPAGDGSAPPAPGDVAPAA